MSARMLWFVEEDGRRHGPVTSEEKDRLIEQGAFGLEAKFWPFELPASVPAPVPAPEANSERLAKIIRDGLTEIASKTGTQAPSQAIDGLSWRLSECFPRPTFGQMFMKGFAWALGVAAAMLVASIGLSFLLMLLAALGMSVARLR